ncbi:MAG: dockerin type I repeat-containing protein [archaeon]|nr:dockerin type I repeat-containing protein [archaeon]
MNPIAIKLVAVIAVVAVVVAGLAIYFNNGSEDSSEKEYRIDGMLPVFGNANEDYVINSKDLDIIEKIIDKKEGFTLKEFPYADANNDGVVDTKDSEIVKKVINKEKTDVYIVNTNFDNSTYIDVVHWPCKAMASAGVSTLPMLYKCAGVLDFVKGMALSEPWNADPYMFPMLQDFKSLGPNMREFDVDKIRDLMKTDGIDCIVCVASLKANEETFKDMGLSIIRPACAAPTVDGYTSAMLLMGFIFDTPTKSLEVSEWFQKVKDQIDSKTKGVTKTRALPLTTSTSVNAPTSSYAQVLVTAGGTFPKEVLNSTASIAFGDWVYSMNDCDAIVSLYSGSSTNSWFGKDCDVSAYSQSILAYKDTKMFENNRVYIVAFDLPMPLKVAYTAVALYPTLFTEKWAEDLSQDFYDKFFGGNIKASEINVFLTTEEIKALAKA